MRPLLILNLPVLQQPEVEPYVKEWHKKYTDGSWIQSLLVENEMRVYVAVWVMVFFVSGCVTIRPRILLETPPTPPHLFSHEHFDRVLRRFVDDNGRVDYGEIKAHPEDLERYYHLVSTYSPESHPALFPTERSQLAYWLNAHNAAVIKTILQYYPINSVTDVRPPLPLFFLPTNSGFFFFQQVTLGGKTTTLYALQRSVISQRFADPRVHFALNTAALSSGRLPRYAFTAEHLEEQLDLEARKFLAEERNVTVYHQKKIVRLSPIFDWHEHDFISWYKRQFPDRKATVLDYVALYVSAEHAAELRRAATYGVEFAPYDWRLNDLRRRA